MFHTLGDVTDLRMPEIGPHLLGARRALHKYRVTFSVSSVIGLCEQHFLLPLITTTSNEST